VADTPKAASININALSGAIDKAVTDVLGTHKLQASKGLAFGPGTLIGRQLRGKVSDMAAVEKAAAEMTTQISKSLGASGRGLTPAALIKGGVITVGFIAEGMFEGNFQPG
jgi:hypothetical protein